MMEDELSIDDAFDGASFMGEITAEEFDKSDLGFSPSLFKVLTPKTKSHKKTCTPRQTLFKEPFQHVCKSCSQPRYFKTDKTLKKHLESHALKDAAKKIPPVDKLKEYCHEVAPKVLQEMKENVCDASEEFIDFVSSVQCRVPSEEWFNFVKCSGDIVVNEVDVVNKVMNGALLSTTYHTPVKKRAMKSLNNDAVYHLLSDKLQCVCSCSEQYVLNSFITQFVLTLCNKVLVQVFMLTRGASQPVAESAGGRKRSSDDYNDSDDASALHYISGAIVKKFVNYSFLHPKNVRYTRIRECIKSCFLRKDGVNACPDSVARWNALRNRKSLTFIGKAAFSFFKAVAEIIVAMERPNGSYGHSRVQAAVFNSDDAMGKREHLVGNTLPSEESLDFMKSLVRSLTNTMGRGALSRRMKDEKNTGVIAIPLRKKLAR